MNIGEKYYCSRCFCELPEEMICSSCGYDPESKTPAIFLEEGTLLDLGRYQVGVPIKYDGYVCCYGAWDYQSNAPVVVKEYLPHELIIRNVSISDDISIRNVGFKQYADEMKLFLENETNDCTIDNRIIHHGVGYLIIKIEPMTICSEKHNMKTTEVLS